MSGKVIDLGKSHETGAINFVSGGCTRFSITDNSISGVEDDIYLSS